MSERRHNAEDEVHVLSRSERVSERTGILRTLVERAILTWKLFWDGRVSLGPKMIPLLALIYVVSPIDLFPELLAGPLGMVDDVGALVAALGLFIQVSPPDVVQEHLREMRARFYRRLEDDNVVEGSAVVLDEE